MKNLKFRAWWGDKMIPVGSIEFFTDGSMHVNNELVSANVMQYTGLKDKNGVEIYEGDIVTRPRNFAPRTLLVEWDVYRGGWSIISGRQAEVIGNLYQNPELCEEN